MNRIPPAGGHAVDPESAPTAPPPQAVGKVPGSAAPARRCWTRRAFLIASAGAAWTAPTVVSISRADASTVGSRPPSSRQHQPMMGPPLATDLPGTLPFTGQELAKEAELAVAALAAGATVVALTRTPKRDLS